MLIQGGTMRSGTRRTSSVTGLYWMSCIISFWKITLPGVAAMVSPTRKASRSLMVMDKVLRLASMSRRRLARPLSRFSAAALKRGLQHLGIGRDEVRRSDRVDELARVEIDLVRRLFVEAFDATHGREDGLGRD